MNILINVGGLAKLIEEELRIVLPVTVLDGASEITVPYQSRKSWRGAVVIQVNGMTIRGIAKREGHSEVFAGRLIHKTFDSV